MKLINKQHNQRLRLMIATLLLITFVNEVQPRLAAQVTSSTPRRSKLASLSPLERLKIIWRPGEQKQMEELTNKVVVLYFWSHKSPTSVKEIPELMAIADNFRDTPVVWIAVHDASLGTIDELDTKLRELEKVWKRRFTLTPVLDEQHKCPPGSLVGRFGATPEDNTDQYSVSATSFGVYGLPSVIIIP